MRRLVIWALCVFGTVLALGCASELSSGTWQASREVAGDTTTVHTLSGQIWPSGVSVIEDLSIGALDGPDELMFGEVTRLAEDPEGGIYVLDEHGPIIRHFDRAGAFVGNVGGPGEGPGEYQHLTLGMVVDPGGTLYLHDWGNRRIARFSADGQALDSWPLESTFLTTTPGTWLYSDEPDRILLTSRVADHPALLRLGSGGVVDTLVVPRLPGMPALRGGPYRVDTYWAWSPAGHFVVGVSDRYSLEAHSPTGVLKISREVPALPVHPDEAEAVRRSFEWMERQPNYRPPEGEWIPSHMPYFRGIGVGRDGRIWVRRNTEPIPIALEDSPNGPPSVGWTQPFLFDVFEPDGSFLGEVRFPDQVQPVVFGSGHIWAIRRGELDEEYVVRLTLTTG